MKQIKTIKKLKKTYKTYNKKKRKKKKICNNYKIKQKSQMNIQIKKLKNKKIKKQCLNAVIVSHKEFYLRVPMKLIITLINFINK